MKIVAISDTHTMLKKVKVPDGDLLIHTGDLTFSGGLIEIISELNALKALPHKTKLLIEGNHDRLGEVNPTYMNELCLERGITPLRNSSITIDNIKFYGSPYTPEFGNWSFMASRGPEIRTIWEDIPLDTNILLTHGPAYGILDVNLEGEHCGCEELTKRIKELPALTHHIFGHIHEGYGKIEIDGVTYINASTCTRQYKPTNKPVIFEI